MRRGGRRSAPSVRVASVLMGLAAAFVLIPSWAFAQWAAHGATVPPTAQPPLAATQAELRAMRGKADFAEALVARADALPAAEQAALLAEFAPELADASRAKDLVIRAATLYQLLGVYTEAARLFELAASRPGPGRDEALILMAARLWLAAGEAERAAESAGIVRGTHVAGDLARESRLVAAWASLISGDAARAQALAVELLGADAQRAASSAALVAPEGSAARREALFITWLAAGEGRADRALALAREYPGSPEAFIAEDRSASAVRLAALPHWYLSGLALRPLGDAAGAAFAASASSGLASSPSGSSTASQAPSQPNASPPQAATSAVTRFQVGVFSKADNASRLAAELSGRGFKPIIEKRNSSGRELYAVIVEVASGSRAEDTLLRLKDAGYEAYPLFQ